MTDAEPITPEAAAEEAAALNADRDGPLHNSGHPKHLDAIDRLATLLTAQGAPSVEGQDPDLANLMEEAMPVPETPEAYDFSAFERPEGAGWDTDQENMFRGFFHAAQLSQPEADQLMTIASSYAPEDSKPVDAEHTVTVLKARYRGDDEALAADLKLAGEAVLKFGGQPLVDWLDATGLGNHLAFFDLALRKAKEMELA
jgi:hypothetical protein